MKKAVIFALCITLLAALAACTTPPPEPTASPTATPSVDDAQVTEETLMPPTAPVPSATPTPLPTAFPDTGNLTFTDLEGVTFACSYGSGSWYTELEMLADGAFKGTHHDRDEESSEEYPESILYFCAFSGQFAELTRISDYEYSLKILSLTQEGVEGEVTMPETEAGYRYVTSAPYGIMDAQELRLYLPGKRVGELPEDYVYWLVAWGAHDDDVLIRYGLYNVTEGYGLY